MLGPIITRTLKDIGVIPAGAEIIARFYDTSDTSGVTIYHYPDDVSVVQAHAEISVIDMAQAYQSALSAVLVNISDDDLLSEIRERSRKDAEAKLARAIDGAKSAQDRADAAAEEAHDAVYAAFEATPLDPIDLRAWHYRVVIVGDNLSVHDADKCSRHLADLLNEGFEYNSVAGIGTQHIVTLRRRETVKDWKVV